jgi:hypothetical protein
MFCPQCGQQQPSDGLRFCPRCGLSLTPHAALLAGGHAAAALNAGGAQAPALTRKRISTRRAAKLMFFSVVSLPIFILLCFVIEGGLPLPVDEPLDLKDGGAHLDAERLQPAEGTPLRGSAAWGARRAL